MSHDFVETRRKVKRLKKLPKLTSDNITAKGGKGNAYRYTKTGFRNDLGIVLRSAWEANFARVLYVHGIKFEFEPDLFVFPIKRGTKGYTPDFYLPATNEYIEIKGWFDDRSRIKMKRFAKYYPEEFSKMTIVISRGSKNSRDMAKKLNIPNVIYYEDIRDHYKDKIKNWEGK